MNSEEKVRTDVISEYCLCGRSATVGTAAIEVKEI